MSLGTTNRLNQLAHPGLQSSLEPIFYPTTATVQRLTVSLAPNGEQIQTWVSRLTNLRGNLTFVGNRAERREEWMTKIPTQWYLNLSEYYPEIELSDRVLLDLGDGEVPFNIVELGPDSMSEFTRLTLERMVF